MLFGCDLGDIFRRTAAMRELIAANRTEGGSPGGRKNRPVHSLGSGVTMTARAKRAFSLL